MSLGSGYVLVKGSHIFKQQGTYDIVVYVTRPDGQTLSDETTSVTVAPMPDTASQPISVPIAYNGAQPLVDDDPSSPRRGNDSVPSYVGVGFSLNPVAEIYGIYNVQPDGQRRPTTTRRSTGAMAVRGTQAPRWCRGVTTASRAMSWSRARTSTSSRALTTSSSTSPAPTARRSAATPELTVSPPIRSRQTLNAPNVTTADAASESPYSFSLTFQDSGGLISDSSVSGATVQVVPPATAAITATLVSTELSGSTRRHGGDASTITANYQIRAAQRELEHKHRRAPIRVNLGGSPA